VDRVHECDRQTDGRTDRITITNTVQRRASHGKNRLEPSVHHRRTLVKVSWMLVDLVEFGCVWKNSLNITPIYVWVRHYMSENGKLPICLQAVGKLSFTQYPYVPCRPFTLCIIWMSISSPMLVIKWLNVYLMRQDFLIETTPVLASVLPIQWIHGCCSDRVVFPLMHLWIWSCFDVIVRTVYRCWRIRSTSIRREIQTKLKIVSPFV